MKKSTCYKCKQTYKSEDGIETGLTFICANCVGKLTKLNPEPLPRKKWFIFWMILIAAIFIIVPFISAERYDINLYPVSYFNLNYTNSTNQSNEFYINCIQNLTCQNTTAPKCDITKTINHGETYINTEGQCNVRFDSPVCITVNESRNFTYRFNYKVSMDNLTVNFTDLRNNESRNYPKFQTATFEDQIDIQCPYHSPDDHSSDPDWEQYAKDHVYHPLNISRDEWYWLCLEPFGEYGKNVKDLINSSRDFEFSIMNIASQYSATNQQLSRENGELKAQLVDYDKSKMDLLQCQSSADTFKRLNEDKEQTIFKLSDELDGSKKWNLFWFVMFAIMFVVFIFYYLYKRFMGDMKP